MKEENLIFIVSQPRSGSTFLQNLLSNNAEVNTCSEPWIMLNFANYFKPELLKAEFDLKLANEAYEEYKRKFSVWNLSEYQRKFLLELYQPLKEDYSFVIDKTPRYWEILKELKMTFPNSKIILLKRNPIEVAKSIMITWNINNLEALLSHRRDLILAPFVINNFWKANINDENVYALKYEEILENPKLEIKKIYKWIGIEYSDKVLNISRNEKYKGMFGDPYQNSKLGYKEAKNRSKQKKLSKFHNSILSGYYAFLGQDFLDEYGNYNTNNVVSKKNRLFSYFVDMELSRHLNFSLISEIKYILIQVFYRIFKIF